MKESQIKTLYNLGLMLAGISLIVFLIPLFGVEKADRFGMDITGFFFVTYGITLMYFIIIQVANFRVHKWKMIKLDDRLFSNSLLLFSISAHTLNIELPVFSQYVGWMVAYMILMHGAFMVFPFRDSMTKGLRYVVYFMCGAGLTLSTYMMLFTLPEFGYGVIAILFFGISAHGTISFWFWITFLSYLWKMEKTPGARRAYWVGALIPIIFATGYMVNWQVTQKRIKDVQTITKDLNGELPEWVLLAQRLPGDGLTEKIVTSPFNTQSASRFRFRPFTGRWGSDERHDPLAITAHFLWGRLELDEKTVGKLLDSKYDARHMTHRRLWRDDDLTTTLVESDITVYPEYRLAYNEKTLTIQNKSVRSWTRQQEAVYSFHLPEGSVVTSLSLWIEGIEQPSRLTTRSKADSAYRTIVGVERRDPALLHWQEGNQVTCTVFPCTPKEDRKFKIGFTIPLHEEDGQWVLDNIWFDGPPPEKAKELVTLKFEGGTPKELDKPFRFKKGKEAGTFTYSGKYLPQRTIRFRAPDLGIGSFQFNGKKVSMVPFSPKEFPFDPQTVVLDLNGSWSWYHWEQTWELVKEKEVYVFMPHKIRVTPENKGRVFKAMRDWQFSLLPLHLIENPNNTLVISRSPERSPNLNDLKETQYAKDLRAYFPNFDGKVKVFNLGRTISPYLQSMKEFRVLDYAEGDVEDLKKLLDQKVFQNENESANRVTLRESNVQLVMTPDSTPETNTAPDHLFRLYAYNDLMRKIGNQYFDSEALEEVWIRQAEEAFVVSPISSLTVLETVKDYDRFDIKENENTLGNAKKGSTNGSLGNLINGSGSTPEPHEWVLITLVGLMILTQIKKRWG